MATNTLSPTRPAVKLSDDVQAGIKGEMLMIQHRANLIAAMDLTDAIRLAQMVLRYAQRCEIDIAEAVSDLAAAGEAVSDDDDWDGFKPIF